MLEIIKKYTIRKYWWLKLLWNKKDSFLYQSGWIRSYGAKRAMTSSGQNIPWLAYSLYKFMDDRLDKDLSVFEYGLGSSSFYFHSRVTHLHGVENDPSWYEKVTNSVKRKTLILRPLDQSYVEAIFLSGRDFDLIIVDGRMRVECCKMAIEKLSVNGVIILDDSHRAEYSLAYDHMKQSGFKNLHFWGFGNGSLELKSSTVFYRQNNIFDL